jgi:23S rRNA pseudouridine1911/1915/1917 synthase
MDLDIIYEDENLLAINKAQGIVVHPAAGHLKDTLANGVKYYLQKKKQDNWDNARVGLVHRLDAATSGVIIFAKTPEALWHLSKQFAERKVKKVYIALVQGCVKKKLNLSSSLGRDRINRKKISSRTKKPRIAYTEITPLLQDKSGKFTLVKAIPLTGRTHQIRVHLSEAGHKIVGDSVYGGKKNHCLMLHAYNLEFHTQTQVSGSKMQIKANLTQDFLDTLKQYDFLDKDFTQKDLRKILDKV